MDMPLSPKTRPRTRFRLRRLVLAGASAAVVAALPAAGLPAQAADGAATAGYRIVLRSDRDGVKRGYSLLADGSHLATLLPRGRRLVPMAVSANGRMIAYMKLGIEPDPTGAIYVSRGSGAGFQLVARSGYAPALSRDGRLLAFTSESLWIARTNGRGRRRLGRCGLCPTLSWAPAGSALVFDEWHSRDVGTWYDIVVQPLHGKRRRLVRVHTEDVEGGVPSWSPSGRWIAYVDDGDDRPRGLWVVRPNGRGLHRVAAGWGFSYAWSPDGRKLAFVRGWVASRVSIVDPGGHEKHVRLGVAVSAVRWSPDGRELLRRDRGLPRAQVARGLHDGAHAASGRVRDVLLGVVSSHAAGDAANSSGRSGGRSFLLRKLPVFLGPCDAIRSRRKTGGCR